MKLANKKIAILLEEGFEDLEFWVTVMRLREEGAQVTVLGLKAGKTVHGKVALPATSDKAYSEVKPDDFDGLVVPGGCC
ncbi:MAG TPA: DJ-1/PfpI family protein, partial [Anaerolineales bacterium]|nr:DJ-1/PfpI family protein [Anaerolineales bacterium]